MAVSGMAALAMAILHVPAFPIGLPSLLETNRATAKWRGPCASEGGGFSASGNMNLQSRSRKGGCGGFEERLLEREQLTSRFPQLCMKRSLSTNICIFPLASRSKSGSVRLLRRIRLRQRYGGQGRRRVH
jgi:hypothetical protein